MEATLIKIDKNGSKHFEGFVPCDRCGGSGMYKWGAVINGNSQFAGVCFKCGGNGSVFTKWIERTAEYQAKLDAKRAEKMKKQEVILEAQTPAEDKDPESDYVGEIGDKIEMTVTYNFEGHYSSMCGYQKIQMTVYNFTDDSGNIFVWKTSGSLCQEVGTDKHGQPVYMIPDKGDRIRIKGIIKDHSEYNGKKQTVLKSVKWID